MKKNILILFAAMLGMASCNHNTNCHIIYSDDGTRMTSFETAYDLYMDGREAMHYDSWIKDTRAISELLSAQTGRMSPEKYFGILERGVRDKKQHISIAFGLSEEKINNIQRFICSPAYKLEIVKRKTVKRNFGDLAGSTVNSIIEGNNIYGVHTTIDLGLQACAQSALKKQMDAEKRIEKAYLVLMGKDGELRAVVNLSYNRHGIISDFEDLASTPLQELDSLSWDVLQKYANRLKFQFTARLTEPGMDSLVLGYMQTPIRIVTFCNMMAMKGSTMVPHLVKKHSDEYIRFSSADYDSISPIRNLMIGNENDAFKNTPCSVANLETQFRNDYGQWHTASAGFFPTDYPNYSYVCLTVSKDQIPVGIPSKAVASMIQEMRPWVE